MNYKMPTAKLCMELNKSIWQQVHSHFTITNTKWERAKWEDTCTSSMESKSLHICNLQVCKVCNIHQIFNSLRSEKTYSSGSGCGQCWILTKITFNPLTVIMHSCV
jgi:hypothetical protein